MKILDSEIYCYEWKWDIRKNLIERSHRSDDEEFYCPRWKFINDEKSFLLEAFNWYLYYNRERQNNWKYLKWKTPIEVIKSNPNIRINYLRKFPVLILDRCFSDLLYHTSTVRLAYQLSLNPDLSTQKSKIDFMYSHNFFNNTFAQNVLDIYLIKKVK